MNLLAIAAWTFLVVLVLGIALVFALCICGYREMRQIEGDR
jgi:hypothetical protein